MENQKEVKEKVMEVEKQAQNKEKYFSFQTITENKEITELIYSIIQKFVQDDNFSKEESAKMKKKIHFSIVSVIVNVLNEMTEKILRKLLLSKEFWDKVSRPEVPKINVSTQTFDSGFEQQSCFDLHNTCTNADSHMNIQKVIVKPEFLGDSSVHIPQEAFFNETEKKIKELATSQVFLERSSLHFLLQEVLSNELIKENERLGAESVDSLTLTKDVLLNKNQKVKKEKNVSVRNEEFCEKLTFLEQKEKEKFNAYLGMKAVIEDALVQARKITLTNMFREVSNIEERKKGKKAGGNKSFKVNPEVLKKAITQVETVALTSIPQEISNKRKTKKKKKVDTNKCLKLTSEKLENASGQGDNISSSNIPQNLSKKGRRKRKKNVGTNEPLKINPEALKKAITQAKTVPLYSILQEISNKRKTKKKKMVDTNKCLKLTLEKLENVSGQGENISSSNIPQSLSKKGRRKRKKNVGTNESLKMAPEALKKAITQVKTVPLTSIPQEISNKRNSKKKKKVNTNDPPIIENKSSRRGSISIANMPLITSKKQNLIEKGKFSANETSTGLSKSSVINGR